MCFGFGDWLLFRKNTLENFTKTQGHTSMLRAVTIWRSHTQAHTGMLHAVTIWRLTNKEYVIWKPVLLLHLAKAHVFFNCMRLCTEQRFILCLVNLQQNESSAGIAEPSVLAHGSVFKGGLCSAWSHRASKTPS